MDVDLARKIIDEIAEKKITERIFFHVMGEPLLHPKFDDLARYIHARGLKLSLYTNSSLLTGKHINRLLSVPIDNLTLSIQSTDSESFILRRAGRLTYDDYVGGVDRFMRAKIEKKHPGKVNIHYMVGNVKPGAPGERLIVTQSHAQAMLDKWKSFFSGLDPAGAARVKSPQVNLTDIEREYPVYPNVVLYMKAAHHWAGAMVQEGFEFRPSKTGYCAAINGGENSGTFAILWDGKAAYCCNDYEGTLDLGNLHEQTIEEVFNGRKAAGIRSNGAEGQLIHPTCQRCMGQLVEIGSGKTLAKYKNPITLIHLTLSYYARNGLRQTARKCMDYLRKNL
jgi:hypothetical protein